jgi:hypothetical protein
MPDDGLALPHYGLLAAWADAYSLVQMRHKEQLRVVPMVAGLCGAVRQIYCGTCSSTNLFCMPRESATNPTEGKGGARFAVTLTPVLIVHFMTFRP